MSSEYLGVPWSREEAEEGIEAWEEMCDTDFRCPKAGAWPRTRAEAGTWALKYGHDVVALLKKLLKPKETD